MDDGAEVRRWARRAALVWAWWGTAWLRGRVAPDDLLDTFEEAAAGGLVVGLGDSALTPLAALVRLRAAGATFLGAAFPAPGDPTGLGGPPAFNTAALAAGVAVLAPEAGWGLVPAGEGWAALAAARRPAPDVGEADRGLRRALPTAAARLADLDVARWRPEAADAILDLAHRPPVPAAPGVPRRCVELAARGLQALEIVDLALADDGGSVSASEMTLRRGALVELGAAARTALAAACSPEGWPPD